MFRLCIDEDSGDRDLVQVLRARGVDVMTAQEVGMIERTDAEHLQFATEQNRVLYSLIGATSSASIHCAWQKVEPTRASCSRANSTIR